MMAGRIKKQRVFLDNNKIIGLDGRKHFCVELDAIEMILLAWYEEYLAFMPDHFSVLIMADSFFLIGPHVENCTQISEAIKQRRDDIPLKEVWFDFPIRWRLRHKSGLWRIPLLPTPGFGIFPLHLLPKYEIMEKKQNV